MIKNILYLGSQSNSRKMLLEESKIPFTIVSQNADERSSDWSLPLEKLVLSIALSKIDHTVIPDGIDEGDICFVLTADTMSYDKNRAINTKPIDRTDAIEKIKMARHGCLLYTGFCLDKKVWRNNAWQIEKRIADVVASEYVFYVPDHFINVYLENTPFLDVSGGMAVERYGNQFLKVVKGSYSNIIGLPMFEIREALELIGFFNDVDK